MDILGRKAARERDEAQVERQKIAARAQERQDRVTELEREVADLKGEAAVRRQKQPTNAEGHADKARVKARTEAQATHGRSTR